MRRLAFALALLAVGCPKAHIQTTKADGTETAAGPRAKGGFTVAESIYDGGLKNGWQDWGWTKRDLDGGVAKLSFANYGGWILAKPGLSGTYGGVTFRYRAPAALGDFLELRVESAQKDHLPQVRIVAKHQAPAEDGWIEVYVPIEELAPDESAFDRIVIRAPLAIAADTVEIDKIALTSAPDAGARTVATKQVALSVDCRAKITPISPLIYGIAYDFMSDTKTTHQHALGATTRRWGGNASTRYNWENGHAWNTANDWYFENVDYSGDPQPAYKTFLVADLDKGYASALTVPTIGWVAKDTSANGFPTSSFPNQQASDPSGRPAGNGKGKDGKDLTPLAASQTSIPASPEFVGRWVEAIRKLDAEKGKRSVAIYILDNEPALWSSTHRDVHPQPVGYDELLDRTIRYGAAIRKADPDAKIAGPAEWGWPAYGYSAKDALAGFSVHPDRLVHGNKPLLAWYLEKLREYEAKTGTRILDLLDIHFYPQGTNVYGDAADGATASLRVRQTRGLWDPSYVDESWIAEPVKLLPRLHEWIDQNYPGRGIQIGEWSFGGEGHVSGGIAVAETLGRFAQNDVASAYYWTYPKDASPAYWACRMCRNCDGRCGHFLDQSVPTNVTASAGQVSLFASIDAARKKLVLVAVNLAKDGNYDATIDVGACGAVGTRRSFAYTGQATGPQPGPETKSDGAKVLQNLPPWSITVLDLELAP
ncbi:hypothetical protein BH09MYX1_BH09MYX1_31460 [soil metagenome]